MIRTRLARSHGDDGVALVAAMGVALIGILVASLVIAQTITASNDSGRDRLRTTEIHSAEAAIDATMAQLETESPCTIDPQNFGNGTQATDVTIDIQYFNDASTTPIACPVGGTPAASPNRATVRATSVGERDSVGLNPERTLEASLALEPRNGLSADAAIFSAAKITVGAGFTLSPQLLDQDADVWVDGGDWDCGAGTTINGSLIVPDGAVNFNNAKCHVGGDVWAQNGFTNSGGESDATYAVDRNLTVRSGNLEAGAVLNVGGDILVGGSKLGSKTATAVGSSKYNVGAYAIPDRVPVGMPVINYTPSDWAGFAISDQNNLANLIGSQYTVNPAGMTKLENCEYLGNIKTISGAVQLPSTDTLYDLQGCSGGFQSNQGFEFALNADTVFFVNDFASKGTMRFFSGDGQPHKLWVIVPYSTSTGSITMQIPITINPPIESFWYAPGTVTVQTASSLIGQVYGGDVTINTASDFVFTNVGVPGVDLVSAAQSSSGFVVELLYKREVS